MSASKVVIITGASKGIGKAIALKFAENKSFIIFLFGRNETKIKSLQKQISKKNITVEYYLGDVGDETFVHQSVATILKKYKKIDILINNAGIAYFEQFVDSNLEQFQTQINTNLIGVYNFTKAVIDGMIKKKNGSIVNIVSQAGKVGFSYGTTYAATKHAVMGFSKSLMLEVRKYNIRVIAVCPGSVETDMIENSPIHKTTKQVLKPKDVADIVFATICLPNRALISELDIRPTNP